MLETKFFQCEHCGNIIKKFYDSGVPVVCCGQTIKELVPKTADAAGEKHVPLIDVDGEDVKVTVGSTLHPMLENHYIVWIYLETTNGGQFHYFNPGDEPIAYFKLAKDEKVISAYEYCNIHSLWKSEL
ncbi:desulfoferrodoxin family protein [Fusobacterium sp. MFO224]|uniref:desulfoferrodoxin family protein n=1 Tax=Fusobacterium sp. MFO224 TaxID=3378070 RepID=UPI003853D356